FLLRFGRLPSLVIAGVIPAPRAGDQLASADLIDTHLNCTERAVAVFVGWIVADDVLYAQLFGDVRGDGGNLADVLREVGASAGIIGYARQQVLGFLRRRLSEEAPLFHLFVNEPDQVDLNLVFLDRLHHFLLFDRAVLFQTVCEDYQRFAAVMAFLLSVIGRGDDPVPERGASFFVEFADGVFEFLPVGGEIKRQFRFGIERGYESLVIFPHLLDQ